MNNKNKMLIGIFVLLLAANAVKWSVSAAGKKAGADDILIKKQTVNFTLSAADAFKTPLRNLFNAPRTARSSAISRPAMAQAPAKKKDWPSLKFNGSAVNNGKKCAFLSGAGFSGAVYEGDDFLADGYTLISVTDAGAQVKDKETGDTKIYTKDGR